MQKNVAFKVVIVVIAAAWLGIVAASWADAAETSSGSRPSSERSTERTGDDEYNFNWLDPEKKIYVLQNRRYLKAGHLLISAMAGTGFSNAYRTSYNLDPRVAFYFNESWGFEAFFTYTHNRQNANYEALVSAAANTRPVTREIQTQLGGLIHWVPWYAKINVFNKILYFDWYFSAGAGTMRASLDKGMGNEDLFALYLGTGHQYHLSQNFLVRLDFMSGIYNATIGDSAGTKAWYSNANVALGLGLKL